MGKYTTHFSPGADALTVCGEKPRIGHAASFLFWDVDCENCRAMTIEFKSATGNALALRFESLLHLLTRHLYGKL